MTLAMLLIFCVATWGVNKILPSGFIPTEDQGMVYVNVTTPAGATVERTEAVLAQVQRSGLTIAQLMFANEKAWRSEDEIHAGLRELWAAMLDTKAVENSTCRRNVGVRFSVEISCSVSSIWDHVSSDLDAAEVWPRLTMIMMPVDCRTASATVK